MSEEQIMRLAEIYYEIHRKAYARAFPESGSDVTWGELLRDWRTEADCVLKAMRAVADECEQIQNENWQGKQGG